MKRLSENDHIDFYRHLAFCAVGGFFGCYAVLVHSGVMGNAQTMNLLELVIDLLRWQLPDMLLHLGALALYVLGTMLTVLLPHRWGVDMHRASPLITAAMAVVLFLLPPELDPVVALYPIFFAMSIQWSSFAGARGFYSSTIFSTNNTKQSSLALAEYLCDHDRAHLRKMWFYLATLGCFHVGASWAFYAVKWWFTRGSLAVLPLVAWGYFLAVCERRHEEAASVPEDEDARLASALRLPLPAPGPAPGRRVPLAPRRPAVSRRYGSLRVCRLPAVRPFHGGTAGPAGSWAFLHSHRPAGSSPPGPELHWW